MGTITAEAHAATAAAGVDEAAIDSVSSSSLVLRAVLWLINKPEWEWNNASRIARDLLSLALGKTHAISVPIRHGRLLWIPSLIAVRGLITIGESDQVRMQWGDPPVP